MNLSTWNSSFGDTAYFDGNPFRSELTQNPGVDYRGANIATYSFQEGYAYPYGNIFQRLFTPRKWEESKGLQKGDASLFRGGSQQRKDYFSAQREKRQAARTKRKTERAAGRYRVVQGDAGYVYKERGDGSIEILASPKGGAGTILRPGDKGYSAIKAKLTARHGAFGTGKTKATAADYLRIGEAASGATLDILTALRRPTAAPPPADFGPVQQTSAMPSWLLPAGIGLVGLVVVASLLKR